MSVERSRSRGRDMMSTGRGGVGNTVRSLSRSTNSQIVDSASSPLAPVLERGPSTHTTRETSLDRAYHTGRGGLGNVMTPTKEGLVDARRQEVLDDKIVDERRGREMEHDVRYSTGRGGIGNMNTSRSRSRSRQPSVSRVSSHSVRSDATAVDTHPKVLHQLANEHKDGGSHFITGGRGGFGNKISTDTKSESPLQARPNEDALLAQQWRAKHGHKGFSSGRGGNGNLAPIDDTPEGLHQTATNGGGGGSRNAAHPHSPPQANSDAFDGRGRNKDRPGMLHKVLRSLSRQSVPRDRSAIRVDPEAA